MLNCCRSFGLEAQLIGGFWHCGLPGGVQETPVPRPSRTRAPADFGDKIIEASKYLPYLTPAGGMVNDFLADKVVPMYVSEDCLLNCSGWQLIGATVAVSTVTTVSAWAGGAMLAVSTAAGATAAELVALNGALAAGSYYVQNGVVYMIGTLDEPPSWKGAGWAFAGGAVIGYAAPILVGAGKYALKPFLNEAEALLAASKSQLAIDAEELGAFVGKPPVLPPAVPPVPQIPVRKIIETEIATSRRADKSVIWKIEGAPEGAGYLKFDVNYKSSEFSEFRDIVRINDIASIPGKDGRGAGQYLKEELRKAFPSQPIMSRLERSNAEAIERAFKLNPRNPDLSLVPAFKSAPGPVVIKPIFMSGPNAAPDFLYIQMPGAEITWQNSGAVYNNPQFKNWINSLLKGAQP